ncbi:hypothetical protein [Alkalicoccobacillus plakortidis]|uniref:Uncharacterized protein n=1 Tax=Alkalicoccobacillus plakortidis TaxID=444060 RepID=A0ABT0XG53_9BACI|nr:hypothetical protein [Alkalicoccobacillus plakortidis]MCM2674680.1 hypothetical protein [Alkalicoccobacillus plakortidis]
MYGIYKKPFNSAKNPLSLTKVVNILAEFVRIHVPSFFFGQGGVDYEGMVF